MPIYAYKCSSCQNTHEVLQKVSDGAPAACPHCSAGPLQKVLAPVGIIFKGSGFHKNDYSGGKNGKATSVSETSPKPSPCSNNCACA